MNRNRLFYISSVNLSSKRAQSLQIKRFVKSLFYISKKEEIEFFAYSLSEIPRGNQSYFKSAKKKLSQNRILNNLKMIIFLFSKRILRETDFVYSRDLLVLLILAFMKYRTIYEYHHPAPFFNTILFNVYNALPTTRLVTISKALKNNVLEKTKNYKKEILVLPSAVEIDKYEISPNKKICRKQLGLNEDKYYILHTGNPYIGRGIERFIELCNFSEDVFFIQIGGGNNDISRLKSLAKSNNIKNCCFLKNISENKIIKYQKAADLLFYNITDQWPTFWCCSPLKLPEYMASGTPILASDIGSITEMIDAQNSYLYQNNSESLKKSFFQAKSNPHISKIKALEAKKKVKKNYTWNTRSKLLINFLKKTY